MEKLTARELFDDCVKSSKKELCLSLLMLLLNLSFFYVMISMKLQDMGGFKIWHFAIVISVSVVTYYRSISSYFWFRVSQVSLRLSEITKLETELVFYVLLGLIIRLKGKSNLTDTSELVDIAFHELQSTDNKKNEEVKKIKRIIHEIGQYYRAGESTYLEIKREERKLF